MKRVNLPERGFRASTRPIVAKATTAATAATERAPEVSAALGSPVAWPGLRSWSEVPGPGLYRGLGLAHNYGQNCPAAQ